MLLLISSTMQLILLNVCKLLQCNQFKYYSKGKQLTTFLICKFRKGNNFGPDHLPTPQIAHFSKLIVEGEGWGDRRKTACQLFCNRMIQACITPILYSY